MSDDPHAPEDWEAEMADDPDWQAMTPPQREKLIALMEKMMETGMSAVYGIEDENVADADVPCRDCLSQCQAKCCTFIFALTKEEVAEGVVAHNTKRPYFIARDEDDGYCPHLDRETFRCAVWQQRPLRCRRYDCRNDTNVWPDGFPFSP